MAEPQILLFTDQFPYGNHEQFLETEIVELAKYNSNIVIVPSKSTGHYRMVPANVALELGLAHRLKASFLKKLLWLCQHLAQVVRTLYRYRNHIFKGDAGRRSLRFLYNSEQTKNWLASNYGHLTDATILYSYWFGASTFGLVQFASNRLHFSVITRTHGHDLYEDRHQPTMIPYREETIEAINKIFFVSKHGLDYLKNKYAWGKSKYYLSPLGVNDPGFLCPASDDGLWRVLSCSAILKIKQLDLLLQSLILLADQKQDVQIVWYHIGDGPLKRRLERVIETSCPSNLRCVFLGQLKNKEVLNFYRENPVDIFVNVSESEGIPVSIMEAQSCGIPAIAPEVGGVPEIVDQENGMLLTSKPSKIAIKDALLQAFSSDLACKRSASRLSWEKRFRALENYGDFYKMLTS